MEPALRSVRISRRPFYLFIRYLLWFVLANIIFSVSSIRHVSRFFFSFEKFSFEFSSPLPRFWIHPHIHDFNIRLLVRPSSSLSERNLWTHVSQIKNVFFLSFIHLSLTFEQRHIVSLSWIFVPWTTSNATKTFSLPGTFFYLVDIACRRTDGSFNLVVYNNVADEKRLKVTFDFAFVTDISGVNDGKIIQPTLNNTFFNNVRQFY